jgi:hypothetical protein
VEKQDEKSQSVIRMIEIERKKKLKVEMLQKVEIF